MQCDKNERVEKRGNFIFQPARIRDVQRSHFSAPWSWSLVILKTQVFSTHHSPAVAFFFLKNIRLLHTQGVPGMLFDLRYAV
jgi:hypothetical protein